MEEEEELERVAADLLFRAEDAEAVCEVATMRALEASKRRREEVGRRWTVAAAKEGMRAPAASTSTRAPETPAVEDIESEEEFEEIEEEVEEEEEEEVERENYRAWRKEGGRVERTVTYERE